MTPSIVRKTALSGPRWVGFDMDECLGSFMGLWPFTDLLPDQAEFSPQTRISYISAIAQRLAQNSQVWFFRPQLGPLLEAMRAAKERGQIAGCFILTNNGSAAITECVRQMLNIRAGSELFIVGWNRYTPCRRKVGSILTKNVQCVQECLRASGLPTLSHPASDLLYFDDMPTHALANEIPRDRYITVKPYFHYTPVEIVQNELRGVFQQFGIGQDVLGRVMKEGLSQEAADLRGDADIIRNRPTSVESFSLLGAFQNFLHTSLATLATAATATSATASKSATRRRRTVGKGTRATGVRGGKRSVMSKRGMARQC